MEKTLRHIFNMLPQSHQVTLLKIGTNLGSNIYLASWRVFESYRRRLPLLRELYKTFQRG
jgi:hypothetical protein